MTSCHFKYTLRNQEKIANVLSQDYLNNHILKSLDSFFSMGLDDISNFVDGETTQNGKYILLRINDISDADAMLEFAILAEADEIFYLAFIGRFKG